MVTPSDKFSAAALVRDGRKPVDKNSPNIALKLDEDELTELGAKGCKDFERDRDSRAPWAMQRASIRRLFACTKEAKSFPWPGSSKAAVPIITVAVSQFQARAREEILPAKGVVNILGTGAEDQSRAKRVEQFMNQQTKRIPKFEDGMDRTLSQVALDGTAFRKTWYDEMRRQVRVTACPASDVVVSFTHTGDIKDARRITHLLRLSPDEMEERSRARIFVPLDEAQKKGGKPYDDVGDPIFTEARRIEGSSAPTVEEDDSFPRLILEQHCKLDLDRDGIGEPYILTIDYDSKKVLRIVSREYDEQGETKTQHFFVKYGFFPNPDGFYDHGLGSLLESYNLVANSIVNMLVDSGSLQNTTTGLVSERAGLKKGDLLFRPGELKPIEGMVEDVMKAVHLFKFPEPSQILFALLGSIQTWGKEISSVNDILQGLEQSANQTATTTITMVEQGLKLFAAVHRRIRSSFAEELENIYLLNRMYLQDEEYAGTLGDNGSEEYKSWVGQNQQFAQAFAQNMMAQLHGLEPQPLPPQPPPFFCNVAEDFAAGYDIQPVADPNIVSQAQRLVVAKETYSILAQNPMYGGSPVVMYQATRRYLEAMGVQAIDDLLPPPPAPQAPPDLDAHMENAMFLKGDMSAQVLPQQDHLAHFQVHREFTTKDGGFFFNAMPPDRQEALRQHMREHQAGIYLHDSEGAPHGSNDMAVQAPQGSGLGGAPGSGGGGGGMDPLSGDANGPATTGPGEAYDNASASLRGRFPGLREASGLA